MKALMMDVPDFVLEWRRKTGADRNDEVWDGVLHMVPSASVGHQQFERSLIVWLSTHWMHSGRDVIHQLNVSPDDDWTKNFRVPDIALLTPEQTQFLRENFLQGPASVVIEILSPGDEAYGKLPFYASLGVEEVWIIQRYTRAPELRRLVGDDYELASSNELGWLTSDVSGIEFRHEPNDRLGIRLIGNEPSFARLP